MAVAPGSGDYTDVNFHGMSQASADFELIYRLVQDEIDDLNGDLVRILGTWVGDAHNSYGQVLQAWNNAAADMNNALKSLGITITNVHGNYSAAERANAMLWQD